jgi:hypothetical protein
MHILFRHRELLLRACARKASKQASKQASGQAGRQASDMEEQEIWFKEGAWASLGVALFFNFVAFVPRCLRL